MKEGHEYNFEFMLTQYDDEKEIPDEVLERILDAMIEAVETEGLRMGGGYQEYCWIHAAACWLSSVLAGWRGRVLRFLGKDGKRKGAVVILDETGWSKIYAVVPEKEEPHG